MAGPRANPEMLDVRRILELTKEALAPYAERAFQEQFGPRWVEKLSSLELKGPRGGQVGDSATRWDSYALLKAVHVTWSEVFAKRLPSRARMFIYELKGLRNEHAHEERVPQEDIWRATDTARRLALDVGAADVAAELSAGLPIGGESEGVAPLRAGVGRREQAAPSSERAVNPWSVLDDAALIAAATREFDVASINPFYSNPEHTLREGCVYLVAQNPGGRPCDIPSQTRREPLDHPKRAAPRNDWCKPLDESWGTDTTTYQKNLKWLAESVLPGGPESLRSTFCTNAVFARGRLANKFRANHFWSICKRWHIEWLAVVKPRVILCLGNGDTASPYRWFSDMLVESTEHEPLETYNFFKVKVCDGKLFDAPATVVGTPHPARWHPQHPWCEEGVDRIRSIMQSAFSNSG